MKPPLLIIAAAAFVGAAGTSHALVIVSEVMSSEGTGQTYAADWFELTNTGSSSVPITGWKIDDDSNSFSLGVALTGVASLDAGQSVVFIEGTSTTAANFINSWFGGSAPAGFTIGTYSGTGVGLGSSGDQVNIFDNAGTRQANVVFSAATAGRSFDNAAGLSGSISTLSAAGVNGAFNAPSPSTEVGSPGVIPEPASGTVTLLGAGTMLCARFRRRNVR